LSRILPRVGKIFGARFAACNAFACIGYSSKHLDKYFILIHVIIYICMY
jgi:hypothetical protein